MYAIHWNESTCNFEPLNCWSTGLVFRLQAFVVNIYEWIEEKKNSFILKRYESNSTFRFDGLNLFCKFFRIIPFRLDNAYNGLSIRYCFSTFFVQKKKYIFPHCQFHCNTSCKHIFFVYSLHILVVGLNWIRLC